MDIRVEKTTKNENELVFTIRVTKPTVCEFSDSFQMDINLIGECIASVEETGLKDDLKALVDTSRRKSFDKIINNLKFAIENNFEDKFKHICQEIYNWIYDHQTGSLKHWMHEYDPQRTSYYFDNDLTCANNKSDQESEH